MGLNEASSFLECENIERVWNQNKTFPNDTVSIGNVLLHHSDTGPSLHITCHEGSHLIGPSLITCLEGGVWSDTTKPTCTPSSFYGIPDSDMVMIGVLAGSGAIIILTLLVIIMHLLCCKDKSHSETSSEARLENHPEPFPPSSFYLADNIYSLPGHYAPITQTPLTSTKNNLNSSTSKFPSNSYYDNLALANVTLPRYHLQTITEPRYSGYSTGRGTGSLRLAPTHAQRQNQSHMTSHVTGQKPEEPIYTLPGHGYPREDYSQCGEYNIPWNTESRLSTIIGDSSSDYLPGYSSVDRTMF